MAPARRLSLPLLLLIVCRHSATHQRGPNETLMGTTWAISSCQIETKETHVHINDTYGAHCCGCSCGKSSLEVSSGAARRSAIDGGLALKRLTSCTANQSTGACVAQKSHAALAHGSCCMTARAALQDWAWRTRSASSAWHCLSPAARRRQESSRSEVFQKRHRHKQWSSVLEMAVLRALGIASDTPLCPTHKPDCSEGDDAS